MKAAAWPDTLWLVVSGTLRNDRCCGAAFQMVARCKRVSIGEAKAKAEASTRLIELAGSFPKD